MTPSTRCSGSFGVGLDVRLGLERRRPEVARHEDVAREGRAGFAEGHGGAGPGGLRARRLRPRMPAPRSGPVRGSVPGHLACARVEALGHEPGPPRQHRSHGGQEVRRAWPRASGMTDDESGPMGPSSPSSAAAGSARWQPEERASAEDGRPRGSGGGHGSPCPVRPMRRASASLGMNGRVPQRTRSMTVRIPSSRLATDRSTSLRNSLMVVSKALAPLST